eukprot:TRINITY_DN13852_c0_g1_i1.p1 TRINITY_DN13852_c0_g1~~TRINITY_DN13852_c0_g1_i1.p1  ORF type:complete len:288 (-),score=104.66 TRINITY_DN13852_c0_g1_i1:375-1238(-)
MIRRPPRSTLSSSSAASDVYKRQVSTQSTGEPCTLRMGDMLEEQQMEIEALEAIYAEEFKVISEAPYRVSIDILDGEDDEQFGVRMQAVLPEEYPNQAPEIEMFTIRRVAREQVQAVQEHVLSLIEENLGTAMLFTLASEAKEWLLENVGDEEDLAAQYERSKQQFETFSDEVIYDQTEATLSRGTVVTPESFAKWKAEFDAEMHVQVKEVKITGRQMFESGEVTYVEDASAEQAEAEFEQEPAPAPPEDQDPPSDPEQDVDLDAWRNEIDLDDLDGLDDLSDESDE